MFATHSTDVYEFLRAQDLCEVAGLDKLRREHEATGKPLADLVVEAGLVDRQDLLRRVAAEFDCTFVSRIPSRFPGAAVATVAGKLALSYGVMPLRVDEQTIDLLFADPFDATAGDELAFAFDRRVHPFFGDPDQVEALIQQHYGGEEKANADALLNEFEGEHAAATGEGRVAEREIEAVVEDRPVIAFVNLVIARAIRAQASDIHFEPFEDGFRIRYRIDGVLHEMAPPPMELALPVTSRIKVLANLDIAERRIAQDGRIKVTVGGRTVDLRVSTLPTQSGESVVLRILDQAAIQLDLAELVMPPAVLAGVRDVIRRPNGIFIVTGPTGCGKTTTLYSALRQINTVELKLLTVEDPIEYEIEGIMQVPVNPGAGLTFASALRSFLRQDPDVVLVGEIRDLETAQIAIQAALTGHLVLSTLHTNDAAGAVTRLIDMGVEPFLIASTLEAVLAQRLVRCVCPDCRRIHVPDGSTLGALGFVGASTPPGHFSRGCGCPRCGESGYRGRRGIYEFLPMTDELRSLVTRSTPAQRLREVAISHGMRTLREDGLRAIFAGETTAEEVLKFT